MIRKAGLPETLMWRARGGQARRVASMLSPRDTALVEAYARECDDSARAAYIEGARVDTRRSVDIQRRDDRSLRAPAKSRQPNQAASARGSSRRTSLFSSRRHTSAHRLLG